MNIAVIPARGGSKRIPQKNIKPFCGKPMIAWSIEEALKSECFEQVVVSSDDEKILAVAEKHGAKIPFVRPQSLADDYTGITAVVCHAVDWFYQHDFELDYVCCIFATTPFIQSSDIRNGLKQLQTSGCDFALGVTSFSSPIQRAVKINHQGRVEMFYPEYFNSRSQDLEDAYHDAGQFCWGRAHAWLDGKSSFSGDSMPIKLPSYRVQDIDTPDDWYRAELMFQMLSESE